MSPACTTATTVLIDQINGQPAAARRRHPLLVRTGTTPARSGATATPAPAGPTRRRARWRAGRTTTGMPRRRPPVGACRPVREPVRQRGSATGGARRTPPVERHAAPARAARRAPPRQPAGRHRRRRTVGFVERRRPPRRPSARPRRPRRPRRTASALGADRATAGQASAPGAARVVRLAAARSSVDARPASTAARPRASGSAVPVILGLALAVLARRRRRLDRAAPTARRGRRPLTTATDA